MVPIPGRRVWQCQAARVSVPQLGGTQRDNIAWGGLQLDVGRPGALDGVVDSQPQGGQGPAYAMDAVAPRQGSELRDGIVHLSADAMCASTFPEHRGGPAQRRPSGGAVVDELWALLWAPLLPCNLVVGSVGYIGVP